MRIRALATRSSLIAAAWLAAALAADAQLTDVTQTPNAANAGIKKSLTQQIGAGRGDVMTLGSAQYIIARDPARAIVRGRQLFQRKFTFAQGFGPRTQDGVGDIETELSLGAGLSDSCASCHGRPFGSAGFGGNVFTRPNSRDAPHLFGLGLKEMLADEITAGLRTIRDAAVLQAQTSGNPVTSTLVAKGLFYGSITAMPDGTVDTSQVDGVDPDLRVRPFFHHGGTISMREFLVGAFNAEMGLESPDPDLLSASGGADARTPSGMWLTGSVDTVEAPPAVSPIDDPDADGVMNEIDPALVDFMEFYLLNYFKPAIGLQTSTELRGRQRFIDIGCADCHVPDLVIDSDRRVADVDTKYDPLNSNEVLNPLFGTAAVLFHEVDDMSGLPTLKVPNGDPFVVKNIFTDFKRHDLGAGFHEDEFDGTPRTEFMTTPLWGVGATPPYGHDGRSADLTAVILRHGGEAEPAKLAFQGMSLPQKRQVLAFLESLVLFAPPDTSSNLDPADKTNPGFPNVGHGSIDLSVLFLDPSDKE